MQQAQDVLKEWMRRVNDGEVDGIVGLYDERAVLIPTFSNRLLNQPGMIRDYYERLCARDELSLALHEKTVAARTVKDTIVSLCGIYAWRFAIDGELLTFEARFSYMLDVASKRPIVQHHSSQIPRML
jgi:hypothetical protein